MVKGLKNMIHQKNWKGNGFKVEVQTCELHPSMEVIRSRIWLGVEQDAGKNMATTKFDPIVETIPPDTTGTTGNPFKNSNL